MTWIITHTGVAASTWSSRPCATPRRAGPGFQPPYQLLASTIKTPEANNPAMDQMSTEKISPDIREPSNREPLNE